MKRTSEFSKEILEVVAEAWASIDGKDIEFLAEMAMAPGDARRYEGGYYDGYLIEAEELLNRIKRRGYVLVPAPDAGEWVAAEASLAVRPLEGAVPGMSESRAPVPERCPECGSYDVIEAHCESGRHWLGCLSCDAWFELLRITRY